MSRLYINGVLSAEIIGGDAIALCGFFNQGRGKDMEAGDIWSCCSLHGTNSIQTGGSPLQND
jgi:hypothetical protein